MFGYDPDKEALVQEVLGSGLVGYPHPKIMVMHGAGVDSASFILQVIGQVMGDYAREVHLQSTSVEYLRGLRLNYALDVSNSVAARAIHRHSPRRSFALGGVPQRPQNTLVLTSRVVPKAFKTDERLQKRLLAVEFPASQEPPMTARSLADEAGSAILNWLIEGTQRFMSGNPDVVSSDERGCTPGAVPDTNQP